MAKFKLVDQSKKDSNAYVYNGYLNNKEQFDILGHITWLDSKEYYIGEWKEGSRTGEKNNFYGKSHTEETKELIRQAHLGTKASDETRQKLSDMRKGEGNNMYGKRGELSPIYGTHRTEEEKMKQREAIGTDVYCIELRKRFPSLSYATKYMKENYGIKINKDTIKANCLGKTKKDWYGEIEINGVMTKLHWTFEKIDTYND